jgi:hypothetical protein
MSGRGRERQAWQVPAALGWRGEAGSATQGLASSGLGRNGRQGLSRSEADGHGWAWQAGQGLVSGGEAGHGATAFGAACQAGNGIAR